MSHASSNIILVTGATGTQGGAVVRSLLGAGRAVRAMTRNPDSDKARALAAAGVEVVRGDFDDMASLDAALAGASGVFSVQTPTHPGDLDTETRAGKALVDAAFRTGVDMFVHTSVARAGDHEQFAGWREGRWERSYWLAKAAVNEAVRQRGFKRYVILKPAMMMENLVAPVAQFMFASLGKTGRFETAIASGTRTDWIAARDIGAFAAAAFGDPDRFHGKEIDLAAQSLTMDEVAASIARGTGRRVSAVSLSEEEALARSNHAGVVSNQAWRNVEGYRVDLDAVRAWGIPLTSLDEFVALYRDRFVIGGAD